jgi:hypothetical protein
VTCTFLRLLTMGHQTTTAFVASRVDHEQSSDEQSPSIRILIRRYAEDSQEHIYPAEDLAGDWVDAEPVCAPWEWPFPHQRRALSSADLPALGKRRCPRCSVWTRTHDHEILVDGKPVAGVLCGELAVA